MATIAGFEFDAETTEAVVTNNENPIGSGPVRFVEATPEESVVFERNPDHFLVRAADGNRPVTRRTRSRRSPSDFTGSRRSAALRSR